MRPVVSMGMLVLVPLMVNAADVRVVDREMRIDGSLDEWGAAERITVDPGGELVGLRGVFRPEGDHEVEVRVLWDR